MNKFEYYEMCDCFNIFEAALLIVGEDPQDIPKLLKNPSLVKDQQNYAVVLEALKNAITHNTLRTRRVESDKKTGIVWGNTIIWRKELKDWLLERKCTPRFFFPEGSGSPDYLNPEHPRYAPKLAATVHAWLAMEDQNLKAKKSPRQLLENWLRSNADKYDLTDAEGRMKESAIKECARIANWKPEGGAPKTFD